MLPVIAHNLLQTIDILANAARALADSAIAGFTLNRERIARSLGENPILVTAIAPQVGYDKAAEIAKKATAEGRSILEVAVEMTELSEAELSALQDPAALTGPPGDD
jgi:fumarate hydratase class II